MHSYLADIVARKRQEIPRLATLPPVAGKEGDNRFYSALLACKSGGQPVQIMEFKRRSPSAGAIAEQADLPRQVRAYTQARATALSILTDAGFGGSFADLALARQHTHLPLLCKDFILDEVQLSHAAAAGADAVLLIAALLTRDELIRLRDAAHHLGMGVLLELHDEVDLAKTQGLAFPVQGVNNRDLRSFRLSLNRANWLARQLPNDVVRITESGIVSAMDFAFATALTDGALIGTSLMQNQTPLLAMQGMGEVNTRALFLKACGIRQPAHLHADLADLIGINFAPRSQRRIDPEALDGLTLPPNTVAVFAGNSAAERESILNRYPFASIQLYHEDVTPAEVAALPQRVWLAIRGAGELPEAQLLTLAEAYAPHVTGFILDSAAPGSGQAGADIPFSFPYPFLLAGGLHPGNLHRVLAHPRCLGADIASGIETNGAVDTAKIASIRAILASLTLSPTA